MKNRVCANFENYANYVVHLSVAGSDYYTHAAGCGVRLQRCMNTQTTGVL